MNSWDERFLELARHIGAWSKDPSTGVGCVIVRPDRSIASVGYNGFPRGVEDSSARLGDRDTKLAFVVHAEPNAIVAAREALGGYTLYCTPYPPCSHCAGIIVQAGIRRVVAPAPSAHQLKRWGESFAIADQIFEEGGVLLDLARRECQSCASEAEEPRVGPDHRNTADYANGDQECSECGEP